MQLPVSVHAAIRAAVLTRRMTSDVGHGTPRCASRPEAAYGGGMSKVLEKWALVTMLVAAALLLIGALVDNDWLAAAAWAAAIGIVSWLLARRRGTGSSPNAD